MNFSAPQNHVEAIADLFPSHTLEIFYHTYSSHSNGCRLYNNYHACIAMMLAKDIIQQMSLTMFFTMKLPTIDINLQNVLSCLLSKRLHSLISFYIVLSSGIKLLPEHISAKANTFQRTFKMQRLQLSEQQIFPFICKLFTINDNFSLQSISQEL